MRRIPLLLVLATLALIAFALRHEFGAPDGGPDVGSGRAGGPGTPPEVTIPDPVPSLPPNTGTGVPTDPADAATPSRELLPGEATSAPTAAPRALRGRVLEPSGTPLPAVQVALKRASDPLGIHLVVVTSTLTDGEGRFTLDDPEGGVGRVVFTREGWSPLVVSIEGPRGSVDLEDLTLLRGVVLRGTVLEVGTERPVPDAEVAIELDPQFAGDVWSGAVLPADTRSDASGRFSFQDLSRTQYRITVGREGYATTVTRRSLLAITSKPEANQTVLLHPADQTLEGVVTGGEGSDRKDAVAGAVVSARSANEAILSEASAVSGDDGAFRLEGLIAGPYLLTASAPDAFPGEPVQATPGAAGVEVPLFAAGRLIGTVLGSSGAPANNGFVELYSLDGKFRRPRQRATLMLDAAAGFASGPLAPGLFRLRVTDPGNAETWSDDLLVAAGETTDATITLQAGGAVEGRIVTDTGAPRSGVIVALSSTDYDPTSTAASPFALAGMQGRNATSAKDGSFVLEHVAEGDYGLFLVAANGDTDVVTGVHVTDGGSTSVGDLPLGGGGAIRGTAHNTDGRPLRRTGLLATSADGHQKRTTTDDEGRFGFSGLAPGTWRVEIAPNPAIDPRRFEALRDAIVERGRETTIKLELRPRGGP